MCDDREKLIAYLYDEADASERRQMDAHLAECAECRDELRSFRNVRQDLLAWDVPPHESVWKPFAAPAVTPWYRQVPAWGLAAAATLMFSLGLAGSVAGRLLLPEPVTTQVQATPAVVAAPAPQVVAATPDQLRVLEERLASVERVALSSTTTPAAGATALTRAELEQLLRDTEGRINQRTALKLVSMMVDMEKLRARDMATITQQINAVQQYADGNLVKALNRATPEKEKEQ